MTKNGCSKKLCPMQVGTVDNCNLTKEQCPYFTQDIDFQKVVKQIKAEVAREIFAEIEKKSSYCVASHDGEEIYETKTYTISAIKLDELKKKYTEGKTE